MTDRTVRVRVIAELPGYAAMMGSATAVTVDLGEAAVLTGRGVRALGIDAAAARAGLTGLGAGARTGAGGLAAADAAAVGAGRGLRTVRGEGTAATGIFGRMGASARSGLGSVRSATESVLGPIKHLGLLLAGGAILYGLHDIVHLGNEYTDSMNKFLEVTRASGAQMAAAGAEAQALGADMKLPSANAAEAADAMVDLAKAGLSAQDAIKAARGTIQLAAAARTDVATAAQIEGDIMDQFALKSSQAAHVADVLANTSNSASGQLMDIYYAMKYVGPIAHTMGVSVKDAATAVGLLGKSGIIGETAGTALRSALVNMAKPTKQVSKGLRELGIQAFDSQGNFKGLRYVITQLGNAQEHMTAQQFTMYAAMAFGKPALSGMTALAHQGGVAFDQFGQQVGRVGGAAALAAAESKGLGGAMRGLGKQLSSAFLQVYLGVAPTLEKLTRGMTSSVSDAIPYIKRGIKTAEDLWVLYGPTVEKKVSAAADGISRSAGRLVDPLKAGLASLTITSIPLAITSVGALGKAFHNAEASVDPLVGGLHDMITSVGSGAGALGVVTSRTQVGVGALGDATAVLRPIAEVVGTLAHAFAGLPGPLQLSVISMLAMRPFRPQIIGMQTAVSNFGRAGINAFRGIGDASLYQRVQAANAGITLGRFGGVMAELERRSPTIAAMGTSFRTTSGAIQEAGGRMVGFRSAVGGVATAVGTGARAGLMGSMRGLWAFLGGPWGVAIGAAMIGLDMLAKHQQKAAQAAQEHESRVSGLTNAMVQSKGVMDATVRAQALQELQTKKVAGGNDNLVVAMRKVGVGSHDLVDAYTGQGKSMDQVRSKLIALLAAHKSDPFSKSTQNAEALLKALDSVSGDYGDATAAAKDYADGVNGGGSAAQDATNPTGRLQVAIKTLGDSAADADTKARALHTALDLLSGGELDVEAAVAQQNQALLDLNSTYSNGVDHAKGYGKALLQVDGSLNTTSENGQTLWTKLQALNEQTAGAAQATYDYARANGTAVVPALQKAEDSMQSAWLAAVKTGRQFGLNADEAKKMAAQMGFIPSSLAVTMSTPGLSQAEKELLYVQGLAGHMPKGTSIKVSALTDEATKAIEAIGFKVKTLPGGRQMEITAPTDKAAAALDALVARRFPDMIIKVSAATQEAINDLQAVKKKLASVPAGHSIKVSAPTDTAIAALKKVGYKITTLPNHEIRITAPTGSASARIAALQRQINALESKTITITTNLVTKGRNVGGGRLGPGGGYSSANGNIFKAYASGGMEKHVAQIAPGGAMRLWAEPETGGEAYIPLARSKRPRSRAIAEETVRMLGGGPVMWYANGGLTFADGGFTYTPTVTAQLAGPNDAMDRYNAAITRLKDAWAALVKALAAQATQAQNVAAAEKNLRRVRSGHHTAAQLAAAEDRLTKARIAEKKATTAVTSAKSSVNAADTAAGLARGAKTPAAFNLTAYQKELTDSVAAANAWRASLNKIATRGGSEVRDILESMGQDGYALTQALAKASDKQFADIVKKLLATAGIAKASLADFENQINASTKASGQFAADLQKLAAEGYGDLAKSLASQGDAAAQALAHQAAGSSSGAAAANAAVAKNNSVLTGDDLTNALILLSTLRGGKGRGYAELLAAGLTTDTIKALVPKMMAQINSLPPDYKNAFLAQWAGQSGVAAMARGDILTRPTMVLAAEAGVPEAYIPLNSSARSRALLAKSAAAMGYHLVPAGRFAGFASSAGATTQHIDRSQTLVLHGAHQGLAEQRADLLRHMQFLG